MDESAEQDYEPGVKVHDVSLTLRPDMPTWPNEDGPQFTPLRRIANGDSANVSVVSFGNHTGTHVDPPLHFLEGGNTVDRLPLGAMIGPCVVVDYLDTKHVSAEWLLGARIPAGAERLLFRTRNSERWRNGDTFDKEFVALDPSAAEWCVESGIKLVGVDYLSVEPFGSGKLGHPVHKILLGAEVVIIEGLDLSAVAAGNYEIFCGPLKLEGGDGAPARVFLIER